MSDASAAGWQSSGVPAGMRYPDPSGPYPRDLIGYGRVPPHPRWPGGARIAVQFYVQRHSRVWVTRRCDIARHWIATHPAPRG